MAGLIYMPPYLDKSTPPSDYLPTKRAQYKVFHNDSVATVSIDHNPRQHVLNKLSAASRLSFAFFRSPRCPHLYS
jgi:hypothetical protein